VIFVVSTFKSWKSRRGGLWSHPDFLKLWAAQSTSAFGAQIAGIAVPLLAAVTLDATALEMGILTAAGSIPFLIAGLFVGVWADRNCKRPMMVMADISRAIVLLAIPIAAVFDHLSFSLLLAVALINGLLSVIFDVADLSYLPSLVRRDQLVEANSKMEGSYSTAQIAGPAIAGVLMALVTAPFALLVNALTFLGSAFWLRKIEHVEEPPIPAAEHEPLRVEITTGLRTVTQSPILKALIGTSGATAFFGEVFMAIYVLYLTRELDLSTSMIGLIFGIGGVGALIGAVLAEPLSRRIGIGNSIMLGQAMFGLTGMLIPLAVLMPSIAVPMVIASEFLQWGFLILRQVNAAGMRQAYTPRQEMGRVQSTALLVVRGLKPIGAVAGGLLATAIGAALTLTLAEIGMLIAVLPLFFSPVRNVKTLAQADIEDEVALNSLEPAMISS
jgi:MFS family permease